MTDTNGATGTDLIPVQQDDPGLLLNSVGTDFLTFAIGSGANVQDQTSYNLNPQRATGYLPGLATSNFVNKSMRQGTFVAHSLSLWISQQLVEYVYDDGDDIKWIGEWTRALSAYMLTLIPPGPNLGLYLPLAGGTMSGNINFTSGVTTVLANNTWYRGLDSGGTSRGLILKSNDNNVYINDGSATYVFMNGIPVTNNNLSWSGKDTTGTARAIAGVLSDNAVHIGSGTAGNIYLDTTAAGGVYFAGNAIYANNAFINWRDTGGTLRPAIGLNTVNQLVIGSGVTSSTEIYAGSGLLINLHNNTNALAQLTVNQMAYLNGGGRAYIAGAHDPFQIYSDSGYYARIHYVVGGTRDWTAGCSSPGWFSISDESAHAVRWEIDLSGGVHAYGTLSVGSTVSMPGYVTVGGLTDTGSGQINGGLTIYNGLNVASGNLTISAGTYSYGGLNVWNGLSINSGYFVGQGGQFGGGLTVYNSLNMASGTMTANGQLNALGNLSCAGQINSNTLYTNYYWSYGDAGLAGNFQVNGSVNINSVMTAGYIHSWGAVDCDHCYAYNYLHADNYLDVTGPSYLHGGFQSWGNSWSWGDLWGYSMSPVDSNNRFCGMCSHQWWAVFSLQYATESDPSIKRDIAPMREIGLELVNAIRPSTFKYNDTVGMYPEHPGDDPLKHPLHAKTHWGFMHPDVARAVEERDLDFGGAFTIEDGSVGFLQYNELTAVLWQAVRELSEKVARLEAAGTA